MSGWQVRGIVKGLHDCAAVLVSEQALARLCPDAAQDAAAQTGSASFGRYCWFRHADRAPVVLRVLPAGALTSSAGAGEGNDESNSCYLSEAAAVSLHLGAGTTHDPAAFGSITRTGGWVARSDLGRADCVHATVTLLQDGYNEGGTRWERCALDAGGIEEGGLRTDHCGREEGGGLNLQDLGLVSARLLPIVRAHLVAQMTSRGAAGQDEHQEIKEDKEEAALAKALVVDESSRVTVEVSEHQAPDAKDWHGGYGQAPLDRDLPDQDCIRPPTTGSADTTLGRQLARKPDGGDGGGLKSRLHAWVSDACKDMPGMHAEVKGCIVAILSALAGDDGGCGGTWVGTGDASTSGEQAYGMQGMLVSGPPGVGKTRLVMTLLRSSPLAWMACKAPALYQAEAGATQQAIQAVFRRAARRAPCVLLIDDIEALAPRAPALNEEVEGRAAHCLLSCLDAEARRRAAAAAAGQGPRRARVFVIGTTSRREALDPAMTQPGRLDAWVHLGVPTAVARRQMLALLTRHLPILPNSRAPAARRHHDQAEARAQTAAGVDRESCLDRLAQAAHAYTPADLQLVLATALRRRLHSGPCEESSQAAAATQTVYSRGDNDQSDNDDEVGTSGDDASRDGHTLRAFGASTSPWHGVGSGRASGCGGRRWAGDGLTEQEVEEAMRVVRPAMLRDRTRRGAVAASRADGPTADASASSSQSPWRDLIDVSGVKLKLRTLVVEALSQRTKFARLGIQPPRGVLLYGPPGAGKTCLALGIAAEAASHANLIAVQATDLIHAQVGQSERAIARLFAQARACAPCLLLLDEIDMLAPPRRQAGMAASGGAQDRVLSQLLIELDGVKAAADAPVMVIAASARPDCIDAALLRPGRLDHHVLVPPPPRAARRLLLTRLMTAHPANLDDASQEARDASGLDPGGDGQALLDEMADGTDGWSLADVQNLCREAGMHALRAAVAAAPDCLPSRHLQTTAADYRAVLAKMRPNVSPCAIVHPLKTWR